MDQQCDDTMMNGSASEDPRQRLPAELSYSCSFCFHRRANPLLNTHIQQVTLKLYCIIICCIEEVVILVIDVACVPTYPRSVVPGG